jgi:hypothetical protein
MELQRLDGLPDLRSLSNDEISAGRVLLADVLETLPALADLKLAIAQLSEKLYNVSSPLPPSVVYAACMYS